jgi:hypothetical protein
VEEYFRELFWPKSQPFMYGFMSDDEQERTSYSIGPRLSTVEMLL